MIDMEWTLTLRIQAQLGNLLSMLLPRARIVPAVLVEHMSQDPQVRADYIADPLIFQGNVRARTGNCLLKAMNDLEKHYAELTLPIYATHGDTDKCTNCKAVELMLTKVSSKDKKMDVIIGGYHEILLGPEKEEVAGNIISWLDAHSTIEVTM
jgi:acylglycerol lipase